MMALTRMDMTGRMAPIVVIPQNVAFFEKDTDGRVVVEFIGGNRVKCNENFDNIFTQSNIVPAQAMHPMTRP